MKNKTLDLTDSVGLINGFYNSSLVEFRYYILEIKAFFCLEKSLISGDLQEWMDLNK